MPDLTPAEREATRAFENARAEFMQARALNEAVRGGLDAEQYGEAMFTAGVSFARNPTPEERANEAWKRVEKERRQAMAQRRRRRGVEAILAELVRLRDLEDGDSSGPAEHRRYVWLHAERILAEGDLEGPRIAIANPTDLESAREFARDIPSPPTPETRERDVAAEYEAILARCKAVPVPSNVPILTFRVGRWPSPEMIEKAAKAMLNLDQGFPAAWDEYSSEFARTPYRQRARAALLATFEGSRSTG